MAFRKRLRIAGKYGRRKGARGRSRKAKRVRRRKLRKTIRRQVDKVAEKKEAGIGGMCDLHLIGGASWSTQNIFPLTPYPLYLSINQGLGSANRIGDKVKLHKATFTLIMFPRVHNLTSNPSPAPCIVRLWLCTLKPNVEQTIEGVVSVAQTAWLRAATGADIGATGAFPDLTYPINTDLVTIQKAWTFKIGHMTYVWGDTGGAAPGSELAKNSYFANNDFPMYVKRRLKLTKYLPRQWKWDNAAATYINARPHFLVWDCVPCNGVALTEGESMVTVSYRYDVKYIDV